MKLSKRLITAARRKAFPWHATPPRGATGAVESTLKFCIEGRLAGATGPQIYARFMGQYRELRPGCSDEFCLACEGEVARAQRLVLAFLEAVAAAERPGP